MIAPGGVSAGRPNAPLEDADALARLAKLAAQCGWASPPAPSTSSRLPPRRLERSCLPPKRLERSLSFVEQHLHPSCAAALGNSASHLAFSPVRGRRRTSERESAAFFWTAARPSANDDADTAAAYAARRLHNAYDRA